MGGLAVVVSPLISLMKDQVDALTECGVSAMRIDSSMSAGERDNVIGRINEQSVKVAVFCRRSGFCRRGSLICSGT